MHVYMNILIHTLAQPQMEGSVVYNYWRLFFLCNIQITVLHKS